MLHERDTLYIPKSSLFENDFAFEQQYEVSIAGFNVTTGVGLVLPKTLRVLVERTKVIDICNEYILYFLIFCRLIEIYLTGFMIIGF